MVRLYVNLGRKEGITPPEIVALLCDVAGVDRHDIGRVQVRDTHSYVSIRAEVQAPVVEKLAGRSHKGRSLIVEPARR
jgi:ATP-dependent RNA helicase DeaD